MISDELDEQNRNCLKVLPHLHLEEQIISAEVQGFMHYHRSEFFQK